LYFPFFFFAAKLLNVFKYHFTRCIKDFRELKKYSKPLLVSLATKLAKGVNIKHYRQWGQAGIRAQLLNIRKKELEMDFVLEGDKQSMHILNAVSPGLTCALPFADYVCDQIEGKIKEG